MGKRDPSGAGCDGPPGVSQGAAFPRWPLTAALLATCGLAIIGAFSPERRLWGINHLAFYPVAVRLGALAAVALSFVPAVGTLVCRGITSCSAILDVRPGLRRWLAPLAAAAALAVFVGFHSSTLLLGDGRLVARSIEAQVADGQHEPGVDLGGVVESERFAKGALLVHGAAARLWVSAFGGTPVRGMRMGAALLGGVLVLVLVRTALGRRLSPQMKVWVLALALGSGAVQIFFGYVENYAPLLLFSSLYLLCGLALAERQASRWIWPAAICLALGIFAHIQAAILLPSMVFLTALALAARLGRQIPRHLDLILLAATVAGGLVLGFSTGLGRYLLPLAGGREYSVLSPAHLADLANEVMLLVPAGILVLAAWAAVARIHPIAATTAGPKAQDQGRFLILALLPVLGLMCLVRPDLGMARDWDLFSMAAGPLVGVSVITMRRLGTAAGANAVGTILVPGLVLTAVLTGAWIGVNSSPERSLDRFEAILSYDASRFDYAYEVLADEHRDRGQTARAATVLQEALARGGPPRLAVKLSGYYEEEGRKGDAIRLLRDTLKRDNRSERARYHLIRLLLSEGAYDELLDLAREGTLIHPEKAFFRYAYGTGLLRAGQIQAGLAELRECLRLGPPDDVRRDIERLLGQPIGGNKSPSRAAD